MKAVEELYVGLAAIVIFFLSLVTIVAIVAATDSGPGISQTRDLTPSGKTQPAVQAPGVPEVTPGQSVASTSKGCPR